jgi:hypothetical protein
VFQDRYESVVHTADLILCASSKCSWVIVKLLVFLCPFNKIKFQIYFCIIINLCLFKVETKTSSLIKVKILLCNDIFCYKRDGKISFQIVLIYRTAYSISHPTFYSLSLKFNANFCGYLSCSAVFSYMAWISLQLFANGTVHSSYVREHFSYTYEKPKWSP